MTWWASLGTGVFAVAGIADGVRHGPLVGVLWALPAALLLRAGWVEKHYGGPNAR